MSTSGTVDARRPPADAHSPTPTHTHRRRRRILWWLVALLVPVIAAAVWAGWFSSWLGVDNVRINVSGTVPASTGEFPVSEVEAVIDVPTGTPLLRVPTDEIAARISALPQVRSVDIIREWPNTLVIDIERRIPIAVAQGPDGFDLVDLEGMVVAVVPQQPSDLPFVAATGAGLPAALAVAAELPPWLAEQTTLVGATTRNDVTLELDSGAQVRWGDASQGALKAQVLQALLSPEWDRYDVSSPAVPTTSNSIPTDTVVDDAPSDAPSDDVAPVE